MLLTGSAVVGLAGHRPLLWLADRRVDPTALLTGWLSLAAGVVVSTLATAILLALPADGHHTSAILQLAGGCLSAISSASVPGWREGLAAVGTAAALSVLLRLAWALSRRIRTSRARSPQVEQLRRIAAGTTPGEPLWIRDDRPLAASLGGRRGLIVMSDTLRTHLTPEAMAATLEHERAHLRGRHHLLVAIAETLASALPFCPLLRAAPAAMRDVVELAADAYAARRCGPAAVQEALGRLTGQPAPTLGLAMGRRLTQTRLARLDTGDFGRGPVARLTGCLTVAAAALPFPTVAGLIAVHAVACAVL